MPFAITGARPGAAAPARGLDLPSALPARPRSRPSALRAGTAAAVQLASPPRGLPLAAARRRRSAAGPTRLPRQAPLCAAQRATELLLDAIPGQGEVLSAKLVPEVRERAERAIKQRGGRVTIGASGGRVIAGPAPTIVWYSQKPSCVHHDPEMHVHTCSLPACRRRGGHRRPGPGPGRGGGARAGRRQPGHAAGGRRRRDRVGVPLGV